MTGEEAVPTSEFVELCPCCKNKTLPRVHPGSSANARMCSHCKSVVDINGKVETNELDRRGS